MSSQGSSACGPGLSVIAAPLLYYFAATLELALRAPDASNALLAPQNGVLVAFLMTVQRQRQWLIAMAVLPAHFAAYWSSGLPWWLLGCQLFHALLLAFAISLAVSLLLRPRDPFDGLREFSIYVLVAAIAAPLLLTCFSPSVAQALLAGNPHQAGVRWQAEGLANSLAMLTWAPCIYLGLNFVSSSYRDRATVGLCVSGTSAAAAVAVAGTLYAARERAIAIDLQLFLIVTALSALLAAIATEERDRIADEANKRLSLIVRAACDVIYDWDIQRGEIWSLGGDTDGDGPPSVSQCSLETWGHPIFPGDRERIIANCRQALSGTGMAWEAEHRHSPRDGPPRWVRHRACIVRDASGAAVRMVGVLTDPGGRKKLEEANRLLGRFARLAMVGQITASIAHEINQPLGVIRYNAEAGLLLLRGERYDENEFREIFEEICRDNRRASELLRRLRDLLQDRELRLNPLNINDVVTDVVKLVRIESQRCQTRLIINCDELPAMLGDYGGLQQVLLNLILNGMDAVATLPEARRRISIRTSCVDTARIHVEVVDSGSGIDAESLPKIFDSFFTSKDDGMGLGLAIARSIVEAHGGRIWAENNADGVGATLAFEIDCRDTKFTPPLPSPMIRHAARLN